MKYYFLEDPFLYKHYLKKIIKRYVPEEEMTNILLHCHLSPYVGHFGANRTSIKVLQSRFYWLSLFKESQAYVVTCNKCQRVRNISKRHEGPLTNILEVEVFDVWGIDFIRPFPSSFGN